MSISRTRKRVKQKAVSAILPVARLGAEFEFTDERLKISLESFPVPKRLISKASLDMVLALNMYYDDIQKKFVPLSAVDISTVRNDARYYTAAPPLLIVNQYAPMRITNAQELMVSDAVAIAYLTAINASNTAIEANTDKFDFNGSNRLLVYDNLVYGVVQAQQAILIAMANTLSDMEQESIPIIYSGELNPFGVFNSGIITANYLYRSITLVFENTSGTLNVSLQIKLEDGSFIDVDFVNVNFTTGISVIKSYILPPFDKIRITFTNNHASLFVKYRIIVSEREGVKEV